MKNVKLLLLAVSLLILQRINAQIFTPVFDEDALQFRVKQIDEFFARFNYETDYKGENPKDSINKEEHRKNLLTIINLEKSSLNFKHFIVSLSIENSFNKKFSLKSLSLYNLII